MKIEEMENIGTSCKSRSLRHSGESRIGVRGRRRNPESLENPGFQVALRLPGMTIFYCFQGVCKSLIGVKSKKWGSFLLTLLVLPFLMGQAPYTPPSNSWKKVDEGFEVRSMHLQGQPYQIPFKLRALRLEITRFPVRVIDSRDFGANRLDIKTMVQKSQALGAVNGGFFLPDYKPLGLLIVDGRETSPLRKADWGVFLIQDNVPKITHTKDFLPDKNISQALQVGVQQQDPLCVASRLRLHSLLVRALPSAIPHVAPLMLESYIVGALPRPTNSEPCSWDSIGKSSDPDQVPGFRAPG